MGNLAQDLPELFEGWNEFVAKDQRRQAQAAAALIRGACRPFGATLCHRRRHHYPAGQGLMLFNLGWAFGCSPEYRRCDVPTPFHSPRAQMQELPPREEDWIRPGLTIYAGGQELVRVRIKGEVA